jgi:hypothetical protein
MYHVAAALPPRVTITPGVLGKGIGLPEIVAPEPMGSLPHRSKPSQGDPSPATLIAFREAFKKGGMRTWGLSFSV